MCEKCDEVTEFLDMLGFRPSKVQAEVMCKCFKTPNQALIIGGRALMPYEQELSDARAEMLAESMSHILDGIYGASPN